MRSGSPGDPLRLFAVAAPGLEPTVHRELLALGIDGRVTAGGVAFDADLAALYRANLQLRTASRILMRLARFPAAAFHELERRASKVLWELVLRPGDPVEVRATSHKSRLYHSDAVAERIHTAIGRRLGGTPAEPAAAAGDALLIVVRIDRDRVAVSADTSGELLHLRGYRQALARAPLRETLAAALVIESGWDPRTPLLDPMCGSGTIAIEAAMLARRIAPGLARRFAFERWPGFDAPLWSRLVDQARADILPSAPAPILASDRDAGAVEATVANAERAGVRPDLTVDRRPISSAAPPEPPAAAGAIVSNPPYGVRVGERAPLRDLYARLGQVGASRFPGWTLALLSADRALERQIGIPLEPRLRTSNGGIPVRVVVGRFAG